MRCCKVAVTSHSCHRCLHVNTYQGIISRYVSTFYFLHLLISPLFTYGDRVMVRGYNNNSENFYRTSLQLKLLCRHSTAFSFFTFQFIHFLLSPFFMAYQYKIENPKIWNPSISSYFNQCQSSSCIVWVQGLTFTRQAEEQSLGSSSLSPKVCFSTIYKK